MKVLFLITRSDTVGGAQVHVRDLSHFLAGSGHQAKVVVGGDGLYLNQLQGLSIDVESIDHLKRELSVRDDTKAIIRFRRIVKEYMPDVISLHSAKAGLVGRIASLGVDARVIFTAHGWSHLRTARGVKYRVFRAIERSMQRLCDVVVTVCDEDRKYAIEELGLPAAKLTTVHNALPDSPLRRSSHLAPEGLRFITVARFQEPKDFQTLIQGFAGLNANAWTLKVIGDGPDEDRVKTLIREFGLEQKIHLLGRSDHVAEHLSQSDVFVLISKSEGFPRSIIEAMRCGLPIVASNVGGIAESVTDSENGFLVPKEDASLLTRTLTFFLDNPAAVDKMGRRSRQIYEQRFTFDVLARNTLRLYS